MLIMEGAFGFLSPGKAANPLYSAVLAHVWEKNFPPPLWVGGWLCCPVLDDFCPSLPLKHDGGVGGGLISKLCLSLATPWAVSCQAPVSTRFFLQADLLLTEPPGKPDGGMVGVAIQPPSPGARALNCVAQWLRLPDCRNGAGLVTAALRFCGEGKKQQGSAFAVFS